MATPITYDAVRVTIGGVSFDGFSVRGLSPIDELRVRAPIGRTIGRYSCSFAFQISREDYSRLRAFALRPFRGALVRRHLAARALARRARIYS